MNAKIVTFSVFSLLFAAAYVVLKALEVDTCCWLLILLAILFGLVPIVCVLAEIIRQFMADSSKKSEPKTDAEVQMIEEQKNALKQELKALQSEKEVILTKKVEDLQKKVKDIEDKNEELLKQVGTFQKILETLSRIEAQIL